MECPPASWWRWRGYVHRLSEEASRERAVVLKETHGYLDEAEGDAFEEALAGARRIETDG